MFEWCVVRSGSKNIHQTYMRERERVQDMIIIVGSVECIVRWIYVTV